MSKQLENLFYRLNDQGNAVILYADTGEAVTRIEANIYPVGSNLSAAYEHPEGIVLSVADAERIGIRSEGGYHE